MGETMKMCVCFYPERTSNAKDAAEVTPPETGNDDDPDVVS